MCRNDVEEQTFFTVKVFTLQEVLNTLWGNVEDTLVYFNMPSNYTINDADAKSISCNE
jgi:hypothetical protein